MRDITTMTKALTSRATITLAALCGVLLGAGPAEAQAWPSAKPIRLVIGFAPGGAADQLARTISDSLGNALGQTVVVENRAGAGSSLLPTSSPSRRPTATRC